MRVPVINRAPVIGVSGLLRLNRHGDNPTTQADTTARDAVVRVMTVRVFTDGPEVVGRKCSTGRR